MIELKKELAEKDEHIMELEKINYQTQKKLADLQKKVIELENKTEGIEFSPENIAQTADVKELQLKLKKRDEILKSIKKKLELLQKTQFSKSVSKPDQKQLDVMKQAISKIKSLQSELVEKNDKIAELRKKIEEIKTDMQQELENKDNIIQSRSDEINKLENEFISFKEEFVEELKNMERQKETISMKQLLDSKKDLEIERDKFQQIIADKNNLLKKREDDMKSLKMMLETRDKKIEELEEKVDKLLLSDESTKTLQSKIKSIEDEYNEKLKIRVEELEKTRSEIILISSELTCACPNLSAEEILEYVDDLMLVSPDKRFQKINEIKANKETNSGTIIKKAKSEIKEEKLSTKEEVTEKLAEESPVEKKIEEEVSLTDESKSEELELRNLINQEIPNLSDDEMETFLQELLASPPNDRKSKLELLKMTQELEEFKKSG